ncbi:hypothetical protein TNCV_1871521 [Trichonephila clavipes]|nr:hypothetical protein TNCV_1871521 [Trichonephila clavipes]
MENTELCNGTSHLLLKQRRPVGTRRRGQPPTCWLDDVEKDLKLMGINRWKTLVIDRVNWRRIKLKLVAWIENYREEVVLMTTDYDTAGGRSSLVVAAGVSRILVMVPLKTLGVVW